MKVATAYYRKSNRHQWQWLFERPVEHKDFVIAWAKDWLSRLDPKHGVTQLGYTVSTHESIRTSYTLESNAPVTRI